MTEFSKPVLLTGASGKVARAIIPFLIEHGWSLRLTDLAPFPDQIPKNCEFFPANLNDESAFMDLVRGAGTIVHLGALVEYGTLEKIVEPNIKGIHTIFEAARTESIRVVNASSNHAVGFYERTTPLDISDPFRPDSYYGLSKAYGELVARYYYDRYGIESVSVRIGSCFKEPTNERMLATWLSHEDLARLVIQSVEAERTGYSVIWGVSDNSGTWWKNDDRDVVGWTPKDSADGWAGHFDPPGSSVSDRFQGGGFCEMPGGNVKAP